MLIGFSLEINTDDQNEVQRFKDAAKDLVAFKRTNNIDTSNEVLSDGLSDILAKYFPVDYINECIDEVAKLIDIDYIQIDEKTLINIVMDSIMMEVVQEAKRLENLISNININ